MFNHVRNWPNNYRLLGSVCSPPSSIVRVVPVGIAHVICEVTYVTNHSYARVHVRTVLMCVGVRLMCVDVFDV